MFLIQSYMTDTFVFEDNDRHNLLRVDKIQDGYVIPESVQTIVNGTADSYAFKNVYDKSFTLSFAEDCQLINLQGLISYNLSI